MKLIAVNDPFLTGLYFSDRFHPFDLSLSKLIFYIVSLNQIKIFHIV